MSDALDIYGTDVAIDASGDVVVWGNGAVGTVTGPENCVQALRMRMRTFPGELTEDPSYGSTFQAIVGKKYDLTVIAAEARNEVAQVTQSDARFLAGENVTADGIAGNNEAARVSLELVLAGGERLLVTDLTDVDVSAEVSLDDVDLDQLLVDGSVDLPDDFIAQDAAEADDLRDAQLLDVVVSPDEFVDTATFDLDDAFLIGDD